MLYPADKALVFFRDSGEEICRLREQFSDPDSECFSRARVCGQDHLIMRSRG
jgi:hypothetical protein